MTKANKHIPLLDAYRFLAAMAVVFFHYFADAHAAHLRMNLLYGNIFEFPSLSIFEYGQFGVDLFFLISGFVIALSAEGRTCASFLASRVARIVPTYWFGIFLTSVFIFVFNYQEIGLRQLFANFFFLQRPMGENFVDRVYWTIAIEFRFYLLVALFIMIRVYKFYHVIQLMWVALCIADYCGLSIGILQKLFITSFGYYFAAGGACYYLYSRKHVIISLVTLMLSWGVAIPQAMDRFKELDHFYVGLLVTVCYALMLVVASRRLDNFHWRWLPAVGALTYPLYLLHLKIGYILMKNVVFFQSGGLLILGIILFMLGLARFVNIYFESFVCKHVKILLEEYLSRVKPLTFSS